MFSVIMMIIDRARDISTQQFISSKNTNDYVDHYKSERKKKHNALKRLKTAKFSVSF